MHSYDFDVRFEVFVLFIRGITDQFFILLSFYALIFIFELFLFVSSGFYIILVDFCLDFLLFSQNFALMVKYYQWILTGCTS